MDSGVGLLLSMVLALVLNSQSKFIIAKLTMWMWCIMNRGIIYVFTGAC